VTAGIPHRLKAIELGGQLVNFVLDFHRRIVADGLVLVNLPESVWTNFNLAMVIPRRRSVNGRLNRKYRLDSGTQREHLAVPTQSIPTQEIADTLGFRFGIMLVG